MIWKKTNITGNENVPDLTSKETRSIRLRITPITETVDGVDRTVAKQLSSILNLFEIGSMKDFRGQIDGIMKISFNTFKITFLTEAFANLFLERYPQPITARGNDEEDVFEVSFDSFMGKIESLTVPVEITEEDLKTFLQDQLQVGKVEGVSWGRHKNH